MRRNQIVFFLIIGGAVLIIAAGLALQALSGGGSNPQNTPVSPSNKDPLPISVAVSTIGEPWISAAVAAYNQNNPQINGRAVTVNLVRQDSLGVWASSNTPWSAADHPTVWIPDASYEVAFANEINLRYAVYKPSLAQTPLVWGGFSSRTDVIQTAYNSVDSRSIQQAASAERWETLGGNSRWQFVKIAFARPNRTSSGLAALLTLVGGYADTPSLSNTLMNDSALQTWLQPLINAVPNFSTLGTDPALAMATRGTSTIELALLPENQWLIHYAEISRVEPVALFYPNSTIILDLPYAIWDEGLGEDERRAARAFGDFLLEADQQRAAGEHGLRPTAHSNLQQFQVFSQAADVVDFDFAGSAITPADRPATLSFLRWFENYRSAP